MDPPQEYLNNNNQPKRRGGKKSTISQNSAASSWNSTSLFEDTSTLDLGSGDYDKSGYTLVADGVSNTEPKKEQEPFFPGQQMMSDPLVANMAMQYGQSFATSGKDMVEKKLDRWLSASGLKYYFAVDTNYVINKLGLVFFPFLHQDWTIKTDKADEPMMPRYELNAPDLYIPVMSLVTYILLYGFIKGTQNRFNPEQLGVMASFVLGWFLVELVLIVVASYAIGIHSCLKYLDLASVLGYKYAGMIFVGLGLLSFASVGYFAVLFYTSLAVSYFVGCTLQVLLIPPKNPKKEELITPVMGGSSSGRTAGAIRRIYMLLSICAAQPVFMYMLTRSLNVTDARQQRQGYHHNYHH